MSDLQQITAPDGVYSIMGNHDYCEYGMDATREKMEKSAKPNKLSKRGSQPTCAGVSSGEDWVADADERACQHRACAQR